MYTAEQLNLINNHVIFKKGDMFFHNDKILKAIKEISVEAKWPESLIYSGIRVIKVSKKNKAALLPLKI